MLNIIKTFQTSYRHGLVPAYVFFMYYFLIIGLLFSFAATDTASAATYYLNKNAQGNNDGSSWENAWRTIADAQAGIEAKTGRGSGDIVLIAKGTYVGQYFEDRRAEPRTDYLTYKAAPGASVTFKYGGTGYGYKRVVHLNGGNDYYLRFEGINFDGKIYAKAKSNYVQIINCTVRGGEHKWDGNQHEGIINFCSSGSHHITVEGCEVHTGHRGIEIENADNVIVRNNNVHNISVWGMIIHACDNLVIENNHIHNIYNRKIGFEDYWDEYVFLPANTDITVYDKYKQEMYLDVVDGFTTGVLAYINFNPPIDFTYPMQFREMYARMKSSTDLDEGDIVIRISEANNGQVSANSVDVKMVAVPADGDIHSLSLYTTGLIDKYPGVANLTSVRSVAVVLTQDKPAFRLNIGSTRYTGIRVSDGQHTNGIVVSGDNISLRKNIIHNGQLDKIFFTMTYKQIKNAVIENNLIYDIECNRFFDLDLNENVTMRNNTFIGTYSNEKDEAYYDLQHFSEGSDSLYYGTILDGIVFNGVGLDDLRVILTSHKDQPENFTITIEIDSVSPSNGLSYDTFKWYLDGVEQESGKKCSTSNQYLKVNNIPHIEVDFGSETGHTMGDNWNISFHKVNGSTWNIYNNIAATGAYFSSKGDNDFNIAQSQRTPGPNSLVISDYPGGTNRQGYKFEDFFVNSDFTPYNKRYDLDYHLVAGSPAINFGDPTNQPADSLGTLGADGFIRNDGVPRDMNHHSAGCYEYISSDPNGQVHVLTITAAHGSVTKTPDKASYNHGETVTLQAVPDTGYNFVNWSGDLAGGSNPATIVMDSDKSVTANFADNTYVLTITAAYGSVTKTPDKASYNYGETVTLQAVPDTGYNFVNWSGDLAGGSNPATIVMNSNKSVTANFANNTYNLTITAAHGSVTKTPDKASYNPGETVTLKAFPDTGYNFVKWTGDISGSSNPATIVMNSNKLVTANFNVDEVDETAPSVTNCSPASDSIQVPLNNLITLNIVDEGNGVDANSVTIKVNNNTIYSGNTKDYNSAYGNCRRSGTKEDYLFAYQSNELFDYSQIINVSVNATDIAGNAMTEYSYSFQTVMRSFGDNKKVSTIPSETNKSKSSTVTDSAGDIWAAWHGGTVDARDIYIGKLSPGTEPFSSIIRLTTDTSDQCNPDLAIGSDDTLYVIWQDNRRGNWDIYASTSVDGINWPAQRRITDSNDNQTNPAIAVDSQSPNRAYVVWQDDRAGNLDIYVTSSNNGFITETTSRITSNSANQFEPAITIDPDNNVYVIWTDNRNGQSDIYGAASNYGTWTIVPIVNKSGNQSSPAIAAEPLGSFLHLLWVDDSLGNKDIYYAQTNGLPQSPLTGFSIIDDNTEADQVDPVIITTFDIRGSIDVFACWQDNRHLGTSKDSDIYFAELSSGYAGTNIFVEDKGTNSNQKEPAMGVDSYGQPYLMWTDDRGENEEIYYAGSFYIEPQPFKSENVSASSGGTIGTAPGAINDIDDVSVIVPPNACSSDVTITISKIKNPLTFTVECLSVYDFGPSGIEFVLPVTLTIPYNVSESSGTASACWYNSLTAALSQQGITDIRDIKVTETLHALSFKTTHFTPFYIISGADGGPIESTGGGGCTISTVAEDNIIEFLLPYIGLGIVMVVLKLRDARNRKNIHI